MYNFVGICNTWYLRIGRRPKLASMYMFTVAYTLILLDCTYFVHQKISKIWRPWDLWLGVKSRGSLLYLQPVWRHQSVKTECHIEVDCLEAPDDSPARKLILRFICTLARWMKRAKRQWWFKLEIDLNSSVLIRKHS